MLYASNGTSPMIRIDHKRTPTDKAKLMVDSAPNELPLPVTLAVLLALAALAYGIVELSPVVAVQIATLF